MIKNLLIMSILMVAVIAQSVPEFIIDFDVHPSRRYLQVFEHFKEPIIEMEKLFLQSIAPKYKTFFLDNLD